MAQINKGDTFIDGELVTGLRLNNLVDLATLNNSAITGQTAVASFDIESIDKLLVYDSSATALRSASIDDIFRSGQTAKFSSISGMSGSNLIVSIASGYFFVVNGNTNITGDLVGTGLIQGATAKFTSELTIPSGNTASRPATPLTGNTRFNTETGYTEIYNGTAWVSSNILPNTNTFTAKNTFSSVVDSTGAFKMNDTVGFALYQIYEQEVTGTGTGLTFVSDTFTKSINEMWVFELDFQAAGSGGNFSANATNSSGVIYKTVNFIGSVSGTDCFSRFIVNIGTALTGETIRIDVTAGSIQTNTQNRLRIYKYKTASNTMVTGKAYINSGTSVTVTSTAHGLSAGQYINIFADKSSLSGRYVISSAATDTFTYANSTSAGSGTLAYIP